MQSRNRYGLLRRPHADVRREVRRRSKFGCVICRAGFYTYEHIQPEFKDATEHDPNHICCLCGSCHLAVTRGQLSKALVRAKYEYVSNASSADVRFPRGPLDLHTGESVLQIAGLNYSPLLRRVVTYYDVDIIRVDPGIDGEPGAISALFLDNDGKETLRIEKNEWIGNIENWDIETVGNRISVRKQKSNTSLVLRFQPPGTIILERLDMRVNNIHLLVGKSCYAAGRYVSASELIWLFANIVKVGRAPPSGIAIEAGDPLDAQLKYYRFQEFVERNGLKQQVLLSEDGLTVMSSGFGVSYFPTGIVIARGCGNFGLAQLAAGRQRLSKVRKAVQTSAQETMEVIARAKKAR